MIKNTNDFESRSGFARRHSSANRAARNASRILQEQTDLMTNPAYKAIDERDASAIEASERESLRLSQRTKKQRGVQASKKYAEKMNEALSTILEAVFGSIVYGAFPMDASIKESAENVEAVYNEAISAYNNCVATISGSPYFNNIQDRALTLLEKEPIDGRFSPEVYQKIAASLVSGDITSKAVTSMIQNKVTEAVRQENLLAKEIMEAKELNESDSSARKTYVAESHTLYRNLFNSYVEEALADNRLSESDAIQEQANANAILGLTILEALHTTKLVDFKQPTEVRKSMDLYGKRFAN